MGIIFNRKKAVTIVRRCPICNSLIYSEERFCSPKCEWRFSQHLFEDKEEVKWFDNQW